MNEKELIKNVENIKQLLTLPDYEKIDMGIELAVSLEEPKIFERLLEGSRKGDKNNNYKNRGKLLNNWMKSLITTGGELNDKPTGYYVYLSLLVNNPLTQINDIRELNLTNGYLSRLPKNFSKLQHLEKLNLQLNKLEKFPNEVLQLKNLTNLHLGWNNIKTIPDEISGLKKLQSLMLGNNSIEKISENLGNLKNLQHLDIGSNFLHDFPSCIFKLKKLMNINYINYNDNIEGFNEEVSTNISKLIPDVYIIQPVQCINCHELNYRVEDTIERHDGYFCESHDEQWDNPHYYCDCCYTYVAARGYTGESGAHTLGNNDALKPGYDYGRWFIDASAESNEDYNLRTIIKEKDGSLSAKVICELCKFNIPDNNIASYEEADKYAEENNIEYWDN